MTANRTVPGLFCVFIFAVCVHASGSDTRALSVSLGGRAFLTLYEYTSGTRTYTDSNLFVQTDPGARSAGMTPVRFTAKIGVSVRDRYSLTVSPVFATDDTWSPRLGASIGDTGTAYPLPSFAGFEEFSLRALVPDPWRVSIAAGILTPRFTLEYGDRRCELEDLHISALATDPYLARMDGIGLELSRTFTLGPLSFPVYVYALNGSGRRYRDNNETPEGLAHIEPRIGPLTLSGSLLGGYYDYDNEKTVIRWSYGAALSHGPFELRAEAIHGQWEQAVFSQYLPDTMTAITTWDDANAFGWYAKGSFRLRELVTFRAHVSFARRDFVDDPLVRAYRGQERYLSLSPSVHVRLSDAFAVIAQVDFCRWECYAKDPNIRDNLDFYRVALGWRAVF